MLEYFEDPTRADFVSAELVFFRLREWNARVTASEWPVSASARARIRRMRTRALCDYMSFYVSDTTTTTNNEHEETGNNNNIFDDIVDMSDSDVSTATESP